MYHSTSVDTKPYMVTVKFNGADLKMEVDTGAALSVISEKTYGLITPLHCYSSILITYTGETIKVNGKISVTVSYQKQTAQVTLIVTIGDGLSLLGRNWLKSIVLD